MSTVNDKKIPAAAANGAASTLRTNRTCGDCGTPIPADAHGNTRYCATHSTPAARKARMRPSPPTQPKRYTEYGGDGPRPGSDLWCAEHGISPEVWVARGVSRYAYLDRDAVKAMYRPFLSKTKRGTVSKIVNQSSGLVMPKHAPPGYAPIPPQLRPDRAVILDDRVTWHQHGVTSSWPVFPEPAGNAAGKHLPKTRVLLGDTLEAHIRKGRSRMPYDPATGEGDHHGIDVEGVHRHAPSEAKYVLLGDDGANSRIDLHPWALEMLPHAERVFFVLEGTLKNDAVLSAGEAVFSVPSVTLWDSRELSRFAETFLVGKTVIVVPDADWFLNPAVDRQALYVRETLRSVAGLQAHIAAPPIEGLEHGIKGVDDFLGIGGGTIPQLVVRGREAPMWGSGGVKRPGGSGIFFWGSIQAYPDTALKALKGLSLHADADGRVRAPMATLARIMGTRKGRLLDMLRRYTENPVGWAAFEIEGSLEVAEMRVRDRKNSRWLRLYDWAQKPTIIVRPEYRSSEYEHPLGS